MNPLLEQLHDIEGLDPVSVWPLAIGWWILIVAAVITLSVLTTLFIRWLTFRRSWKNDALKKLDLLEANLSEQTTRETLITLAEYLRRIVLKRFSRKECAALMGEAWLKWLSKHDTHQFDWEKKGGVLIDASYAPLHKALPAEHIIEIIQATRKWVR